jgi:molecular chaperone HtpG
MTETKNTESYTFQAEINQLMSLIINTFYSNKEIFLRELVSNASDALDKIRHQSLTDKDCLGEESNLKIRIQADKENKLLHIFDTGIGMTKQDLIDNLGTIARSGTKEFMQKISQNSQSVNLIGQFGVGFYSAFLVADIVDVYSKHNNDSPYKWESSAGGSFTITKLDEMPFNLKRGTCLTLHIKDEQSEYLEENKLKEILKKHSQFVGYDIELYITKSKNKEVADDDNDENKDDNEKEEKTKKTKTVSETYHEFELQNTEKPIWLREPNEISKEEYGTFYKTISNDWEEHLAVKHFKMEGQIEFRSLLYVPKRAPFDMFEPSKKKRNLKLYVKKVFIMDDCEELCPEWLSFVRGIVDSDDLPLNVSREMLQQNKILSKIKKTIIKKSLELFDELSQNEEDFKKFYEAFGKNLKLGVHEDSDNRQKLCNLLRYTSSNGVFVSLKDYCSRAKNDKIYYLSGDNLEALKSSPFIEKCNKKGYEVVFMTDPIDEYVMQQVKEFKHTKDDKEETFKFVNLSKEGFNVEETEEEKKERESKIKDYEKLCKAMKETLGDKVEKVLVSTRLCDTPCVLVTGEFGWSAYMQKIMKSQALRDNTMASYMIGKKTLEINPDHKIIRKLYNMCDNLDKSFKDIVSLMYDSSLLVSGFELEKPKDFNDKINNMICLGLGLDDEVQTESKHIDPVNHVESEVPVVPTNSPQSKMEAVD